MFKISKGMSAQNLESHTTGWDGEEPSRPVDQYEYNEGQRNSGGSTTRRSSNDTTTTQAQIVNTPKILDTSRNPNTGISRGVRDLGNNKSYGFRHNHQSHHHDSRGDCDQHHLLDFIKKTVPYLIFSLGAIVLLLYGLVLAGSASNSPGMSGLYLVSVNSPNGTLGEANKPKNVTTDLVKDVVVRVGYFGKSFSQNDQVHANFQTGMCTSTRHYPCDAPALSPKMEPRSPNLSSRK